MHLVLASLACLIFSGLLSWIFSPSKLGGRIGAWGGVAGCLLGLAPTLDAFRSGLAASLRLPWDVPGGSFYIALDALSGLFLLPILGLAALGAIYGSGYMAHRNTPRSHWFFYNLLTAGMMLVVLARNGLLFLSAWEIMALASFFLVVTDDERENVREAGWTYLVAAHLGAAFLLGFFALLGREAGTLDFDGFTGMAALSPGVAGAAFLLALVGFGSKAGFIPFHIWLPEAHPAAPSHVSAVMSGVMIKTGIYGIVRALTFLGPPPAWWGWLLLIVGLTSGIGGVLFALAQHDLKRLLAYHSVENIGIITMGLGIGLLGLSYDAPLVAALGFAGGLLHIINHAIFKGLLFLGAGSVIHATGTGDIDHLGGLLKRMPRTGLAFLIGAAAIAGLPPLNGFVSEYFVFMGSFHGVASSSARLAVPLALSLAGLALISGLAVACFAKAFGIVFLGEPCSEHAMHAHESGGLMAFPQLALAAACVAIGLLAPFMPHAMQPVVMAACGLSADALEQAFDTVLPGLQGISFAFGGFFLLVGVLALLRMRLLARRPVTESGTWDCGYAAPTARMQYTASSFAQPLVDMFHTVLRTRRAAHAPEGLFPQAGAFSTETLDTCREGLYRPLFTGIERGLGVLRRLQHGNLHLYVLYIALTLLALLIWKLG